MKAQTIQALCVAATLAVCSHADGSSVKSIEVAGTVTTVHMGSFRGESPVLDGGKLGETIYHLDMSFEVKDEAGKTTTFQWGDPMDATKAVDKDRKPAKPGDIKKGSSVKVKAAEVGGRWIAKEIQLK